ncbi:MAG: transposase [Gammaproteobacteria bacterium]|jgi:putative transposase|nr:transposase [Gammaproteobacteria bacterium]
MSKGKQHRLRIGRYSESGRIYLITFACYKRRTVFDSLWKGQCFARSITALATDTETWCWVVMPDHVHWLMAPSGELNLSRCVQKLKALTTRSLKAEGSDKRPVWQHGFHDRALRKEDDLRSMARYVIANPVRAGLVRSVRDWPFWDASWI